ncbi:MAG: sulfurtransferase TusA family protein [Desulfomonilaceae bacterium]
MMKDVVDARGLSCPQPVLLTLSRIKKADVNAIEILVDNEVSRENVCRAAGSQGWTVKEVVEGPDQYKIAITRS